MAAHRGNIAAYTMRVVNTSDRYMAVESAERDTGDSSTVFVPPGLCRNLRCTLSDDVRVHAMPRAADSAATDPDPLRVASLPMTAPDPHMQVGDFLVLRDDDATRVAYGPPVRMYISVDMSDAGIGAAPLSARASAWAAPPVTREGGMRTPPDKRHLDTSAGMMATACLVGREFVLEHDGEVFALPTAPMTYAYQLDGGAYLYVTVSPTMDRVRDGARAVNVSVSYTGELVFAPQYF